MFARLGAALLIATLVAWSSQARAQPEAPSQDRRREVATVIDEADWITNTLGTARLVAREAKARLLLTFTMR